MLKNFDGRRATNHICPLSLSKFISGADQKKDKKPPKPDKPDQQKKKKPKPDREGDKEKQEESEPKTQGSVV